MLDTTELHYLLVQWASSSRSGSFFSPLCLEGYSFFGLCSFPEQAAPSRGCGLFCLGGRTPRGNSSWARSLLLRLFPTCCPQTCQTGSPSSTCCYFGFWFLFGVISFKDNSQGGGEGCRNLWDRTWPTGRSILLPKGCILGGSSYIGSKITSWTPRQLVAYLIGSEKLEGFTWLAMRQWADTRSHRQSNHSKKKHATWCAAG